MKKLMSNINVFYQKISDEFERWYNVEVIPEFESEEELMVAVAKSRDRFIANSSFAERLTIATLLRTALSSSEHELISIISDVTNIGEEDEEFHDLKAVIGGLAKTLAN